MQVKMVTTTTRLPGLETALLDMEEHQVRLKCFEQSVQCSDHSNQEQAGRGEIDIPLETCDN